MRERGSGGGTLKGGRKRERERGETLSKQREGETERAREGGGGTLKAERERERGAETERESKL